MAVRPGSTGRLVGHEDVAALATAMRELLTSPEERAALGAEAREVCRNEFDFDRMTAAYATLFGGEAATSAAIAAQ
jgi:glycosyltransferase involved in cell wall biosynthesis